MVADVMAITKARSMLIILLATCQQTLLAIDAVDLALEKDLAADLADELRRVIARSEPALEALNAQLRAT